MTRSKLAVTSVKHKANISAYFKEKKLSHTSDAVKNKYLLFSVIF